MGLFNLTGLLAQAEAEELVAGLVELDVDLGRGEFADFFGFHIKVLRFAELGGGGFADDEAALEGQLGIGEAEGLLGDGLGHAGEFEENGAGLDLGDVVFHRALAGAHSNLGGFLGDRLVGENADPEFALALEVARDGDAGGLDLAAGHGTAAQGLEGEFAEGDGVAALRVALAGAFLRFAVFGAGGSESHCGVLLFLDGWCWTGGRGLRRSLRLSSGSST